MRGRAEAVAADPGRRSRTFHDSQRSKLGPEVFERTGDPVIHAPTSKPLTNRSHNLFPLLQLVRQRDVAELPELREAVLRRVQERVGLGHGRRERPSTSCARSCTA